MLGPPGAPEALIEQRSKRQYTRNMQGPAIRWSLMGLALLALVLVPFALAEKSFQALVESWLSVSSGLLAVGISVPVLLALDVILPVPSTVVATASGMLLGFGRGAAVTWVGLQAGAAVGYFVGRSVGMPAGKRFVGPAEFGRAERSHRRWGGLSLIACRAVPVLAESSVILAGAVRMPFRRFCWLTGLANAAIAVVYASVGAFALEVRAFLLAFAASIALPGLAMGLYRVSEMRSGARRARSRGLVRGEGAEVP